MIKLSDKRKPPKSPYIAAPSKLSKEELVRRGKARRVARVSRKKNVKKSSRPMKRKRKKSKKRCKEWEKNMNDRRYIFKQLSNTAIGVISPKEGDLEKIKYYIQIHKCPNSNCGHEILTCSCPSFQIQKPGKGIDAFHDPCKHIKEYQRV